MIYGDIEITCELKLLLRIYWNVTSLSIYVYMRVALQYPTSFFFDKTIPHQFTFHIFICKLTQYGSPKKINFRRLDINRKF